MLNKKALKAIVALRAKKYAGDGTRTHTSERSYDPQSYLSANSNTPAKVETQDY